MKIVDYLKEKCNYIDDVITKKEQFVNELENYKKSLIYEYVTGKGGARTLSIDVTTEKRFEADIEEFFYHWQVRLHP